MSWVRMDDTAPEHRKQLAAGPLACWLWVCGLAYCNRQKQRDGFIPAAKVPLLYPIPSVQRQAERLVDVGLWERADGGFVVHDYHQYQPSPPDAEALRAKRSAAGRLGGVRSGEARRTLGDQADPLQKRTARAALALALKAGDMVRGPCAVCGTEGAVDAHHSDYSKPLEVTWLCRTHHHAVHADLRRQRYAVDGMDEAPASEATKQVASEATNPVPARPDPVPIPTQIGITPPPAGVAPSPPGPPKRRAARIPAGWQPSATTLAWCAEQGIDGAAAVPEFVDHWTGTGEPRLDWDATFRNHVRKLVGWGRAPRAAAESGTLRVSRDVRGKPMTQDYTPMPDDFRPDFSDPAYAPNFDFTGELGS